MNAQLIKAREMVAMFNLVGFTTAPAVPLTSAEMIALLASYLEIVIGHIESSGGNAVHTQGDAVLGFWSMDASPSAQEAIGRAVIAVISEVSALHVGDLPLKPIVGMASGLVLHTVLQISGKQFPISVSPFVNQASRLSSLCTTMRTKILFPAGLPVVWPDGTTTEFVETVRVKGMDEPLQLMTLREP